MRIELLEPKGGVDDPLIVQSALGLVMENPPDVATIVPWTKFERLLAYDWAMRHHFKASDNLYVKLRPKPSFIR